ncbi:MAG: DNA-binding response regulator [Bacillus thermozeamaize]|uniref:DNA-binding response regulator n=1 Tax=Bacillus thermozeamaize TaxID=230954 RepID=A0A1Y3PBB4_9BACI|nr:MAG: DNA-binding response regulator [Bacillus thermozeamaize]
MGTAERNQVLVVEDDEHIRRFVVINLERSGFVVAETAFGAEALAMADRLMPDVVVLDIMLPDMNGFDICRRLRAAHPEMAILMLTARGQDMDKVTGLELGADDYIVKPFNPLELVARMKAILRRTKGASETRRRVLRSGPFTLDLTANECYKAGHPVELTPKEFQMMKVFMENPGHALDRDRLLDLVWGQDFVGDPKTVDVHVRRLREKIEADPSRPKFIETVWGLGYRWRKGDSVERDQG